LKQAIASYQACAALRGWDEESAWACYRAAECWCVLGEWGHAVDECAAGLARHAGLAELAWLAAYASYKGGRATQAVWWARASIALGRFRGVGEQVQRISFRNPMAQYAGPYDVLRGAYRALGDGAAGGGKKDAATRRAACNSVHTSGGDAPPAGGRGRTGPHPEVKRAKLDGTGTLRDRLEAARRRRAPFPLLRFRRAVSTPLPQA